MATYINLVNELHRGHNDVQISDVDFTSSKTVPTVDKKNSNSS